MTGDFGIPFETLQDEREQERAEEIRSFVVASAKYLSAPILLFLWLLDFIYVPHLVWQCLAIRLSSIPFVLCILWLFRKPTDLDRTQKIATLCFLGNAGIVTALMWITEGISSPYYAGLNLVAFGIVCVPWTTRYLVLNVVLIYYPFLILGVLKGGSPTQFRVLSIHVFFIAGTVLMCLVMRLFMEKLRLREIWARLQLKSELRSRDTIIRIKTQEMVNLNQLVKQFSPQVVHAIQSGEIKLEESVKARTICAIFIDIVHSTDRLQVIPIDQFTQVISNFMKDTTHILLSHDVTIDKYLGDGVLAFSGAPMSQQDYLLRVASAAVEIRDFFKLRQADYTEHWKHPFEVRFGISSGMANVGFYGSETSFRSYTAIGEPVNLASRLCASADRNSILIERSVYEAVRGLFETTRSPLSTFKGFEGRSIETYQLGKKLKKIAA